MQVQITPIGEGRLLNTQYTEEKVSKSVDYALILDKIVKARKLKKDFISVSVEREKALIVKSLLQKEGFDVEIAEVLR
jgi:hypothetical protein